MTKVDEKAKRALAARPMDYEVGFGKPPQRTRFAKGQSGNRDGRPKGARSKIPALNEERLKAIVLEEAYRDIKVNDGDRQVTLSMAQAIIRSLALAAVKGEARAQAMFTRLLGAVEQQNKALHDEWLQTAINYKADWEKILRHRKELGVTLPDPVPHPDDVIIDRIAGTAHIAGAMTKDKKAVLDECQARAKAEGVDLLNKLLDLRNREGGGS